MKKKSYLLTMCLLIILVACGSNDDPKDKEQREEDTNQETEGYYETVLVPLNVGIAGSINGAFNVRIRGDEVRVRGNLQNAPAVVHRQFIHKGSQCPGPDADLNRDGILDFDEALEISGPELIPLDQNLSTQLAGFIFPSGNYSYFETTSLVRMIADLHGDDPVFNDSLDKLEPDEGLNLSNRTIMIFGVKGNANLPIACGTIARGVEPLPDGPVVVPVPPRNPLPPTPVPLPPRVPWDDAFSTRLSADLMISGAKCSGGEMTPDDCTCQRNQWIVTIDNETDLGPFVANLVLDLRASTFDTAYYHIRPVSPIDDQTFLDARDHWVRFDRVRPPLVLRKPAR